LAPTLNPNPESNNLKNNQQIFKNKIQSLIGEESGSKWYFLV